MDSVVDSGDGELHQGEPVEAFASRDEWRRWLAARHASSKGLWVKLAKKSSGIPSITYQEALEVALCYGWIDGLKHPLDDRWWLQRFTPRGPRSKWSKINCSKVTELIASGAMHPAGLAEVERAKADGRWEAAYHSQRTATPPEDFLQALAANPEAEEFFATLTGTNRYSILYRIADAKRPETRARRIAEYVEMLARHETLRGLLSKAKPGDAQ